MAEVFRKALEAAVTLKTVTVSEEVTIVTNISYYLHNKRSVTFVIN
jgi:hypothetical protein